MALSLLAHNNLQEGLIQECFIYMIGCWATLYLFVYYHHVDLFKSTRPRFQIQIATLGRDSERCGAVVRPREKCARDGAYLGGVHEGAARRRPSTYLNIVYV